MGEIERINIVELLSENGNLLHTGHQIPEDESVVFKNLFFPYPVTIGHKTLQYANQIIGFNFISGRRLVFINCDFAQRLMVSSMYFGLKFDRCTIKAVELENINHSEQKNLKFDFISSEINDICIKNCSFTDRFYINPQYRDVAEHINQIENLLIQDSVFGHNFKLHNCVVQHCNINNTDFEKNADFFKSKFLQNDDLLFKSINFRGLALFGECWFSSTLRLEYVTFGSMSHFRKAMFKKGLDLDKANIEKEMNFYDVQGLDKQESKQHTSQETYRIIKYNFSKIGNQIEANRFHKFELDKRAEYLEKHKNEHWREWLVFSAHKCTSDMGRSWVRPLLGIVIIGMLTNGYLNYKFSLAGHLSWDSIGHYIDHTFQFMSIIADKGQFEDKEEDVIHWVMFFNKVLLGYLYYQFVTAVRKDTTQK